MQKYPLPTLLLFSLLLVVSSFVIENYKSSSSEEIANLKLLYKRDLVIPYPKINPYTEAKYNLGKMLFFDPRLSDTNAISCATCHNPAFSWTDGHKNTLGKELKPVGRKAMTLLNLAWDKPLLWDARAPHLESQVAEALFAPDGMSNELPELLSKIKNISEYRDLFSKAFANEDPVFAENDYINLNTIKAAIATFERQIISPKAPFDLWIEGNESAISESAKRGFMIFNEKGNCASCHSGWRFSDGNYYNIGVKEQFMDVGSGIRNLKDKSLHFTFKAVGLRNIDRRPPYMHNGSIETLEEVIEFYNKGGEMKAHNLAISPLNLSAEEKADLLSFLKTLTSHQEITVPSMPQ